MSLDFSLQKTQPVTIYERNITHNVGAMWKKAGVYEALYESEGKLAKDVILTLAEGYKSMCSYEELYTPLNAENGWGTYEHALEFLKDVLKNCIDNPYSIINISK